MRSRYQGPTKQCFRIGVGSAESYAVLEKTAPRLKQVLFTCSFALFVIIWTLSLISVVVSINEAALAISTLFIGMLLPIPIPWLFRYCARRKLRAS
jgi:hypothetical protein